MRKATRPGKNTKYKDVQNNVYSNPERHVTTIRTVKWVKRCACRTSKVRPCVVLDPFVGSGTTCCVALARGRRSMGIDLSTDYLQNNAVPRITGELLIRPAMAHLLGIEARRVKVGKTV